MLHNGIVRELPQIAGNLQVLIQILVHREDGQLSLFLIPDAHAVQNGNLSVGFAFVGRRLHKSVEHRPSSVHAGMHVGIENGLSPCAGIGGHDGRNHVHKLCQTGDLYTVGMAQQGDEHASHQKGVFKIIDILQLVWSLHPFFQLLVRFVAVIPDVPLIKGKIDLLLAPLFGLHAVRDGQNGRNEFIHSLGICQKFRRVVVPVSIVLMKGKIVHLIIALGEHFLLPVAKGIHGKGCAAAGHGLNGRIHEFHQTAGLRRDAAVFLRSLMSHLPGTVHLVAQAPEFDVMGLFIAVLSSQVAVVGALFKVAVFQHILRFFRPSGSQIDSHHHVASRLLRPVHELVQAELVGFDHLPGQIHLRGTLIPGANAVLPVIAGDEISARIPDDGYLKLPHQCKHVLSHSLFVRKRASLLINSFIYRTSQVLNKGTENSFVHFSGEIVFVHNQFRFFHVLYPLLSPRSAGLF